MAEKTITRTAIAEFYLPSEEDDSRRHVHVGEEVELTPRQFEKYSKAGCVLKDEDQNEEVKARAEKKAKAAAPEEPTPASVPKSRTEMRTEDGEREARAEDAAARDAAAADARAESDEATQGRRGKK